MDWFTSSWILLQCVIHMLQCNTVTEKQRIRKEVYFIEKQLCSSWTPLLNITTPHSLQVSVQFDGFCHKLSTYAPGSFTWAFDIEHRPGIPNVDGSLERFFCNCNSQKLCTKTYNDLLLKHNVMYEFKIIPHCFKTLCENCVRALLSGSWRNESIITKTTGIVNIPITDPEPAPFPVLGPVLVIVLVLLSATLTISLVCYRYRTIACKEQCVDSTNYSAMPNNQHQEDRVTIERSARQYRKKKVLLLNDDNHGDILNQFLSVLQRMNKYITVDMNEINHDVNDSCISNLLQNYHSVILIYHNWMVSEVGIQGGIRHLICSFLNSFKSGPDKDISLHVVLIEENEDLYKNFRETYNITHSTPYFLSRDFIIQPVVHLLANICMDRVTEIPQSRSEIMSEIGFIEETEVSATRTDSISQGTCGHDRSYTSSATDHTDPYKKVLLLMEQNTQEYTILKSVLQELRTYISFDDINTLITSPEVTSNKYDWAFAVPNKYHAVVLILQEWMVERNDQNTGEHPRNPVEEMVSVVLEVFKNRNTDSKVKLCVILKNENEEILKKFRSRFIFTDAMFSSFVDMRLSVLLEQILNLVFNICGNGIQRNDRNAIL